MKKILAKLSLMSLGIMGLSSSVVLADGPVTGVELSTTLSTIITTINTFATPIGSFLIFIAVLMVGFSILKNKDKADERSKSMESLLWLAVGAFVIGAALTIAGVLIKPADDSTLKNTTTPYNTEIQAGNFII
ncbi:MAG TPA: hypothetical protein DEP72_01175 [Clostridiales bacterium]|nr:MAG: hypothetical protein A2Y18_01790 [Clostridiales bacterium GWD2_32_19]HCC06765.1 hypothetical protein [Clostridiales bacterium]